MSNRTTQNSYTLDRLPGLCELSQVFFKCLKKPSFGKILTKLKAAIVATYDLALAESPAYNVILEIQKYKVGYIWNIYTNIKMIIIRVFEYLALE